MTIQVKDKLFLAGERFITNSPGLPDKHVGIRKATDAEVEELGLVATTACYRGYVATWQISERRLFLVGLRGVYAMRSRKPIFAQWATARLEVPMGRAIATYSEYSCYRWELRISVHEGRVSEAVVLDCLSACSADAIAEQKREDDFWKKLGEGSPNPVYPTLSMAVLRHELGDVQKRAFSRADVFD